MLDERVRESQSAALSEFQPQGVGAAAITLRCAGCGNAVDMAVWQPVIRCAHCRHLVYPDRSLRNLLPLGWDCPECHHTNDHLANFCVHCGAGLASRCLQCEAPVTGPVCLRCGEHQAHLRQMQKRMAEREDWLPIQRERVHAQMEYERAQAPIEEPPVPAAAPLTPREARAARKEQKRVERRSRKRGGSGWGWWPLIIAAYFVAQKTGLLQGSTQSLIPPATASPAPVTDGLSVLQGWWATLPSTLSSVQTLRPDDPKYSIVFAALLIGVASLPSLLYMVDRTIKRLFP